MLARPSKLAPRDMYAARAHTGVSPRDALIVASQMAGVDFVYNRAVNARIESTLSQSRLRPYRAAANGDLQGALDLYVWNVGASAALYGPLSVLEVVFRNAMDAQLRALFGSDWPRDKAFLAFAAATAHRPARSSGYQPPDLRKGVRDARRILTRAFRSRHPGAPTPVFATDDIVAATTFGYWTTMLDAAFEPQLWARALKNGFPHYSSVTGRAFSRAPVAQRFHEIRTLRNRVMHHEPPIKRENLIADYDNVIEACSWIDHDAAAWIQHHARFRSLLETRDRPRHVF